MNCDTTAIYIIRDVYCSFFFNCCHTTCTQTLQHFGVSCRCCKRCLVASNSILSFLCKQCLRRTPWGKACSIYWVTNPKTFRAWNNSVSGRTFRYKMIIKKINNCIILYTRCNSFSFSYSIYFHFWHFGATNSGFLWTIMSLNRQKPLHATVGTLKQLGPVFNAGGSVTKKTTPLDATPCQRRSRPVIWNLWSVKCAAPEAHVDMFINKSAH